MVGIEPLSAKDDGLPSEALEISWAFYGLIEVVQNSPNTHEAIAAGFRNHIYGGTIPKATPPSYERSNAFWSEVFPHLDLTDREKRVVRKSYSTDLKLHDSCLRALVGTVAARCPESPLVAVRDEMFFGRYKNPN